jgi:hypothetical protein
MAAERKATRPPRRDGEEVRTRMPVGQLGSRSDSALRVTDTEVERSEIAAIKRRWLVRIHQKDLALTDHVAVLPERKRASAVVLVVRDNCLASIDRNKGTERQTVCPSRARMGLSSGTPRGR